MQYLEYLLLGYLVIWPIYIYLTHEKEKQSVIANPEQRIAVYRITMLQLWLPVMILMILVSQSHISMSDIGLQWQFGLANQIGVAALVLIGGYFLMSLKRLSESTENHQAIRKQLAYIQWLMPTSVKESRYFILGVSITAAVCEELLFRGYLMHMLADYMPTYGVVIISSLAFGLPHLYQGPIHILRTALIGGVMALIYLATDSIIVPIVLHAVIDMYSGALAYLVLRKQPSEIIAEKSR
ncbi:CPBP family intramembrane metalloprotease [Shewanella sp. KX20019]|uniref:CPBP family intramembrane glutamic endopeptidase n=1 Tax=Shewanella sp. KX20019 TaxID=2803864 RepID=UPI0019265A01|nr:CPBP family intramembrane glutamic endopeptidase [Shewanella sp. KX20019]QQX81300.1 CPBP family intramembrane metalloprotease [Shewanella sp. KX20019]